ncbi:MAG: glycoside hydrolase family 5 protein, partial [Chloroflexota bacterium]
MRRGAARRAGALLLAALGLALLGGAAIEAGAHPGFSPFRRVAFYQTKGNRIIGPDGRPFFMHGLNRPSLEWSPRGEHLSKADIDLMAGWGANVIRIPTNQDFLLADSCHASPRYGARLDQVVKWIVADGMNAIIDLHWTDRDQPCIRRMGQQVMPDERSVRYLRYLARHYRTNPHVFLDLFNEPHGVGWACWRNGCIVDGAWRAVGMQELYDVVRSAGFRNPVLVEGLDWGRDLRGLAGHLLDGHGIAYSVHPWYPDANPVRLDAAFGFLAGRVPIVAGEFGPTTPDLKVACNPTVEQRMIRYFQAPGGKPSRRMGWLAWEWYAGGNPCGQVIADWQGTPSPNGVAVHQALAR